MMMRVDMICKIAVFVLFFFSFLLSFLGCAFPTLLDRDILSIDVDYLPSDLLKPLGDLSRL